MLTKTQLHTQTFFIKINLRQSLLYRLKNYQIFTNLKIVNEKNKNYPMKNNGCQTGQLLFAG
jgi:hypothetical protein